MDPQPSRFLYTQLNSSRQHLLEGTLKIASQARHTHKTWRLPAVSTFDPCSEEEVRRPYSSSQAPESVWRLDTPGWQCSIDIGVYSGRATVQKKSMPSLSLLLVLYKPGPADRNGVRNLPPRVPPRLSRSTTSLPSTSSSSSSCFSSSWLPCPLHDPFSSKRQRQTEQLCHV